MNTIAFRMDLHVKYRTIMIKAVIFDLDGTLLDTEKYFRICWPKAFEHFGYKMTDEQALYMRSLGRPFTQEFQKKISGDPNFDYEKVRSYRAELMEQLLAEKGLELKPGALEILSYLKEHKILRAIATASPVDRTVRYLERVGIQNSFDKIISARMVQNGKPAPDVYIFACEQLGLQPQDCLAVEDSPNGVLSAYRAGCKVCMIPDQDEPDPEISKLLYAKLPSLDKIAGVLNQE